MRHATNHGKHRAPLQVPRVRAIRRLAMSGGAIASVAILSFAVAVPAQAAESIRAESAGAAAYAAYLRDNSQTLSVAADESEGSNISRDAISASSEAAVSAANQAAAAAAAEAAMAAANLAPSAVGVIATSGYTGPIIPARGSDPASIIAYAQQFVGVVPYIEAPTAVSPSTGFECDSFVDWVWAHTTGRILPRGVNEIAALGTPVPASAVQPGDLVVYPGAHIGIYAGNGTMIDAPQQGEFVKHQVVWGNPVYVRL